MERDVESIAGWIEEQVHSAKMKGVVLGLSGGLDSSVTAVICQRVFPETTLGLIMPCYSHPQDVQDALQLSIDFSIPTFTIDLGSVYNEFIDKLLPHAPERNFIAEANVKPRLRMTALYYYANLNNYLVVGTSNKSELIIGYFTKYGDGGVDIEPLGNMLKSEVYEAAKYLNIPKKIIDKDPSAGLWLGQTDQQEIGLTYKELDNYLETGEAPKHIAERVEYLIEKNRHKSKPPPVPNF